MPPPKVLFLLPYPLHHAPSQRFRVELYFPALRRAGISFRSEPFLDKETWRLLYQPNAHWQKAAGVFLGFIKRFYCVLVVAPWYSHVFIHREAAPLGPPLFEWIIAKILQKKIIYDFDDAIWIPNTTQENWLAGRIKCFGKIKQVCAWSGKIVAGNAFLAAWACRWNRQVAVLPTCVDVVNRHNQIKDQSTSMIIIGWTGSHSTMKYLDQLVPVLQHLAELFNGSTGIQVNFLIISNKPPLFSLSRMEYLPWSEASEIQDLLRLNIGLMPLVHDSWSEGKCGFKLIQYLSLGIPAVASPVGVNKDIIENGRNGYLCDTAAEWLQNLRKLVEDEHLRYSMGHAGRRKIMDYYSVQAHEERFIDLFS